MDYNKLAELLYPNVQHDMQYYLNVYPARKLPAGAEVTRLGPSPTGYLHIGHLYSAMISRITATKTHGVFYLRLEDTDQKRYIPGAGDVAYDMLCYYGVKPDEGYRGDNLEQIGEYGDYVQSHRTEIYQTFAKELVKRGRAFPCFCGANDSKEDILERREKELSESETITEHDEHCRNLSFEQIKANIEAGKPWALKLLSTGDPEKQHDFVDLIKGKRVIRENGKDIVLVKSNGIPPYALAHVVDDTLMGTTIVVRGEEWYPSVAAHIETFLALGLKPPKYAHTPVISKLDDGNKRKLSKRKDPEADVRFYIEQGYPKEAVKEYVLNLLNSDFEMWRNQNPLSDIAEFPFSIKKIGSNNPMFDFEKLNNISKNIISRWPAERVFAEIYAWAEKFDGKYANLLQNNKETMIKMLSIDRGGDRPRKDIFAWSMVKDLYDYIFNDIAPATIDERINKNSAKDFLKEYIEKYDHKLDKQAWFDQIKQIALGHNFADNKEYKANPSAYAGNVADACNLVRVAVTGKTATPDLCSIMQLLGKDKVKNRLQNMINSL
ncbi:MAG: glutamate--tRNA ligase [Clostridia bacterium]|nr:glutamate--tRNA ligase [Clostridia bacterium]